MGSSQSVSEKLILLTIAFALSFKLPALFLPGDVSLTSASLTSSIGRSNTVSSMDFELLLVNTSLLGDGMHPSFP